MRLYNRSIPDIYYTLCPFPAEIVCLERATVCRDSIGPQNVRLLCSLELQLEPIRFPAHGILPYSTNKVHSHMAPNAMQYPISKQVRALIVRMDSLLPGTSWMVYLVNCPEASFHVWRYHQKALPFYILPAP